MNYVVCTFQLQFSFQHAQRIQACVIEPSIDDKFYAVASDSSKTVLSFDIHDKRDTKFLPRYIGEKFPNLEEVTAYNCSLSIIRSFYFSDMRNVRYMDLSFNSITRIEKKSFNDLFNVKYLYLGNNRIKTLDRELFNFMISLKDLDLVHNKISSLDPDTFKIRGGKLIEVNLLSNVCIDASYASSEDIIRLEDDLRNKCNEYVMYSS